MINYLFMKKCIVTEQSEKSQLFSKNTFLFGHSSVTFGFKLSEFEGKFTPPPTKKKEEEEEAAS